MSRVQLALSVSNIDAAVAFYSKLFGTESAKTLLAEEPARIEDRSRLMR